MMVNLALSVTEIFMFNLMTIEADTLKFPMTNRKLEACKF